jgi:hypothetical protein
MLRTVKISPQPRNQPPIRPKAVPMTPAISAEAKATPRLVRAPQRGTGHRRGQTLRDVLPHRVHQAQDGGKDGDEDDEPDNTAGNPKLLHDVRIRGSRAA